VWPYILFLQQQARCLFYNNRQDACSTTTGKMPVLQLQQQARCLFYNYNNRQDACSTITGKMPVLQLQQQARCLFYNNRQDACSTTTFNLFIRLRSHPQIRLNRRITFGKFLGQLLRVCNRRYNYAIVAVFPINRSSNAVRVRKLQ
jgi:hypothetical protein